MNRTKLVASLLIGTTWLMATFTVGNTIKLMELEKDTFAVINSINSNIYHLSESEPNSGISDEMDISVTSIGDYSISYYCPCELCCGKSDGITASEVPAEEGVTCAVEGYPFGTKLLIDGAVYTVQDRFGAPVGNKIDIFVQDHERAELLGRHTSEVYIMEVK